MVIVLSRYTILKTLIIDIDPDPKVKEAMNSINAAQRLRVAAADTAESRKITIVKAAEAGTRRIRSAPPWALESNA